MCSTLRRVCMKIERTETQGHSGGLDGVAHRRIIRASALHGPRRPNNGRRCRQCATIRLDSKLNQLDVISGQLRLLAAGPWAAAFGFCGTS